MQRRNQSGMRNGCLLSQPLFRGAVVVHEGRFPIFVFDPISVRVKVQNSMQRFTDILYTVAVFSRSDLVLNQLSSPPSRVLGLSTPHYMSYICSLPSVFLSLLRSYDQHGGVTHRLFFSFHLHILLPR